MIEELPVPPDAQHSRRAVEFARGWIIDGVLCCSLNVGVWGKKEPAFWGHFLSDIARHIVDAMNQEAGLKPDATMSAIRESFLQGLEAPGGEFSGEFV